MVLEQTSGQDWRPSPRDAFTYDVTAAAAWTPFGLFIVVGGLLPGELHHDGHATSVLQLAVSEFRTDLRWLRT
jgi:hypothetical protein